MIKITSDLATLEESFIKDYLNKSFSERTKINEECYLEYNMGCVDLYRKIRANILSGVINESSSNEDIIKSDFEQIDQFDHMDIEELKIKYAKSEEFSSSINRVIIPPCTSLFSYDEDQLNAMFDEYNKLSNHNKIISDYNNRNIWGYNVKDMYHLMLKKLGNDRFSDLAPDPDTSEINNLRVQANVEDDQYSKIRYECGTIEDSIKGADYQMTPYFNQEEMNKYSDKIDFDRTIECLEDGNYFTTIRRLQNQGKYEEVLKLAWNPSVPISEEACRYAYQRNLQWLKEHGPKIIDLQKNFHYYINESSHFMRRTYDMNDMYPVYIVLSYTNTAFGNIIRKVRNSQYTHAALALDSDLKTIYTFKFDHINGKSVSGFQIESLDYYISKTKYALIDVLVIFVDKTTIDKMKVAINNYMNNKTKYGFRNLFSLILKKAKSQDDNEKTMEMICSQFVDTILKLVDIDLTMKPSNLVEPKSLEMVASNPKVYRVYDGYATRYNEKAVETYIKTLFNENLRQDIIYKDTKGLDESVISELQSLVTPEFAIYEKKLPVEISNNGDLTIKTYKSLEREYQEAHKLLTSYSKDNLEGIKQELARLFYLNFVIEDKVKRLKKAYDVYKQSMDLRARILNDFKKYFKVVSKEDPEFNFGEYFESSEYNNIIIKKSTLKFAGRELVKFLTSLKLK